MGRRELSIGLAVLVAACSRPDRAPPAREAGPRRAVQPTTVSLQEIQIEWLVPQRVVAPEPRVRRRLRLRASGETDLESIADGGGSIGLFRTRLPAREAQRALEDVARARPDLLRLAARTDILDPLRVRTLESESESEGTQTAELTISQSDLRDALAALDREVADVVTACERQPRWLVQMYLAGVHEHEDGTLTVAVNVANEGAHAVELRHPSHRVRPSEETALQVQFFAPLAPQQRRAPPPVAREGVLAAQGVVPPTLRVEPHGSVEVVVRVRRPADFAWFNVEYRNVEPAIGGVAVPVGWLTIRGGHSPRARPGRAMTLAPGPLAGNAQSCV